MKIKLKIYLVGGAIRDKHLGLPVSDRDWLVVGGNEQYFLDKGYERVGKDFPVFLHPENSEEYALARKERKVAKGYQGFEFEFNESVTIEEDLIRRDLTINAMAEDEDGNLVDPFNGMDDLKNRKLRHVSEHFREDPLRVLRVARFMARYSKLGFEIHDETMKLMKEISKSDELEYLSSERILLEMSKAFKEDEPSQFFYVLRKCGALKKIMPEVDCLFGVRQPKEYHPEIDTGIHVMMTIEQAKKISNGDFNIMYAALVHDLGKGITPEKMLPNHVGHEENGVPLVEAFSDRLKVSSYAKKLALLVTKYHLRCHRSMEMSSKSLYNFLNGIGAFKKDTKICNDLIDACIADARGRTGFESRPYPQKDYILHIVDFVKKRQKDINKLSVSKANQAKNDGLIKSNELGIEIAKNICSHTINVISEAKDFLPQKIDTLFSEVKFDLVNFNNLNIEDKCKLFDKLKVKKSTSLLEEMEKRIVSNGGEPLTDIIEKAIAYRNVKGDEFIEKGLRGKEVGNEINKKRKNIIK